MIETGPVALICDWNGTLFGPPTDEPLHRVIARAVVKETARRLRRLDLRGLRDLFALIRARFALPRRLAQYRRGRASLHELYDLFNHLVIRGRPAALIEEAARAYAAATVSNLDRRLLEPVRYLRARGVRTGILSVTHGPTIHRTLALADAADLFPVDHIVANTLRCSGPHAQGFTLDIYGAKARWLEAAFFAERGLAPERTFYIGDSEDDAPVASILPRGHFVVSFMASPSFRARLVAEAGAFAPDSSAALVEHIERLLGPRASSAPDPVAASHPIPRS